VVLMTSQQKHARFHRITITQAANGTFRVVLNYFAGRGSNTARIVRYGDNVVVTTAKVWEAFLNEAVADDEEVSPALDSNYHPIELPF
jgi:hypothetical protein